MSDAIRIVFAGTGAFGRPILEHLIQDPRFQVAAVISGPDKEAGRGLTIGKNNIVQAAEQHRIPVHQEVTTAELNTAIKGYSPDILLVVAYGKILHSSTLAIAHGGSINIHGSLIPAYRGASPIHAALLNNDEKTGVSWLVMGKKMDAGPLIKSIPLPITDEDDFPTLYEKLSNLAAEKTGDVLYDFSRNHHAVAQNESEATYSSIIEKKDGELYFDEETAKTLVGKVRAYVTWPGAYFMHKGKRIKVLKAHWVSGETIISDPVQIKTKEGIFIPDILQPESKRPMDARSFAQGYWK